MGKGYVHKRNYSPKFFTVLFESVKIDIQNINDMKTQYQERRGFTIFITLTGPTSLLSLVTFYREKRIIIQTIEYQSS